MEQEQSSKFLIPAAIMVAGVLVAGAIYYGGKVDPNRELGGSDTNLETEVRPVDNEDHYLGNRNAELVIVEYSDTECPFCKVFHNTMIEVAAKYEGRVGWVYRHFPIPQLHAKAVKEAEALECVASIAGEAIFWRYLDKIFETTNSNDSLDATQLPILAVGLGVNEAEFNACLSSGQFSAKIEESMAEAVKAGARGTPYSIILDADGEVVGIINGAEPIDTVTAKIDAALR